MTDSQLDRFAAEVKRKQREAKAASEHPEESPRSGPDSPGEQASRVEAGRTQDSRSVRAKSAGKGKKTADKWNQ